MAIASSGGSSSIAINSQVEGDLKYAIPAGLTRFSFNTKFGRNGNIGNNQTRFIAPFTPTFFTSAGQISISSDDNSDRPASTGAHAIRITGLDGNYDEISEDIALNGTSTVTTTTSFLRVLSAFIITAGSQEVNDGDITGTIGGNTAFIILEEKGRTEQLIFTVPAGKTAYITSARISTYSTSGNSNKQSFIELFIRTSTGVRQQQLSEGIENSGGTSVFEPSIYFPVPEKTDVYVLATSLQNSTAVSGVIQYFYEDTP